MLTKKESKLNKKRGDLPLLITVAALSLFGLIAVYSASYYTSIKEVGHPYEYLISDGMWLCIGAVFFIAFAFFINEKMLRRWSIVIMAAGLVLLCLIFTPLGYSLNNATRWLLIPGTSKTIMPGEIIKPCLIIFIATFYAGNKSRAKSLKANFLMLIVGVICGALILLQPNASTAAIVIVISVGMIFVAGIPKRQIAIFLIVAAVFVVVLASALGLDYMYERVAIAFDPWSDPLGEGYQIVQSELSLGSGGVFGLGLGKSLQKIYLPEAFNDYIFAIIGEETGLVGCIILIAAYIFLIYRCVRIAILSRSRFGTLVVSGTSMLIGVQVILNIAISCGWFIPTGVFLPFISYGGNATIVFMSLMGMVYNISRNALDAETIEESEETEETELVTE